MESRDNCQRKRSSAPGWAGRVSGHLGRARLLNYAFANHFLSLFSGGLNPQTSRNDVRIICIPLPLPARSSWDPASRPLARGLGECVWRRGLDSGLLGCGGTTGSPASWAQPGPLPIQPPLQSSFNFLFLRKRGAAP